MRLLRRVAPRNDPSKPPGRSTSQSFFSGRPHEELGRPDTPNVVSPALVTIALLLYKKFVQQREPLIMPSQRLSISEARRQLSRLVSGVGRTGKTVTITQHGREQAALISIREYHELSQKAHGFDRSQAKAHPLTVKGSLELNCSPEELEEMLLQVRRSWTEAMHQSVEEFARERAAK